VSSRRRRAYVADLSRVGSCSARRCRRLHFIGGATTGAPSRTCSFTSSRPAFRTSGDRLCARPGTYSARRLVAVARLSDSCVDSGLRYTPGSCVAAGGGRDPKIDESGVLERLAAEILQVLIHIPKVEASRPRIGRGDPRRLPLGLAHVRQTVDDEGFQIPRAS
jgi:hypothetical protein